MSAAAKTYVSLEQYLELERRAEFKSEYHNGEVFAMAGGSPEHSLIAANVTGELRSQLLTRPCRVYNSDLRVQSSETLCTYPDVTVVCGEPQFSDENRDTLLNPTVIVVVLSRTTEAWDRGGKFEQYRQRASLLEYVLIAQDRPHVERFDRQPDGQWLFSEVNGREGVLALPSVGCELALDQVYHQITFLADNERPG